MASFWREDLRKQYNLPEISIWNPSKAYMQGIKDNEPDMQVTGEMVSLTVSGPTSPPGNFLTGSINGLTSVFPTACTSTMRILPRSSIGGKQKSSATI